MVTIEARNTHSAMIQARATYSDYLGGDADVTALPGPLAVSIQQPRERVAPLGQNPAQDLADLLVSIYQAREVVMAAAKGVRKCLPGFHLTTQTLVVRMDVTKGDRLSMTAVTTEANILRAAMGPMLMQLSFLQELIALQAELRVGELTMIQTNDGAITKAGREVLSRVGLNPYTADGIEPYEIREDLDQFFADIRQFIEVQDGAVGYKSPFIRHVAIPMLQAAKIAADEERPREDAVRACSRIKASDWRRAMEEALA